MNHDIAEALMFNGITPPPDGGLKTTCPICSHARRKSSERCLKIYPMEGRVEWACFHCGWQDGDAA